MLSRHRDVFIMLLHFEVYNITFPVYPLVFQVAPNLAKRDIVFMLTGDAFAFR